MLHDTAATVATETSSSWIWGIPGPEKLRLLVWTICHNAIPTASLLHHRRMLLSATCKRCANSEETTLHCLQDCVHSKDVWLAIEFNSVEFFTCATSMDWIRFGVQSLNPHLFLAAVWFLWCVRNSAVIASETTSGYTLRMSIHYLATLIINCFKDVVPPPTSTRMITWYPSRDNSVIVLNVDGSSIGNPGRSGFGGLLRSGDSTWLGGFAGFIGIFNNLHAKLLALYYGLTFTWNKGHRAIICFDSENVLHLINAPLNIWNSYASIIQNIKELLQRAWSVQLSHTIGEGNACADFMTKLRAVGNTTWTDFDTPPTGLGPHLVADAVGVAFARS